MARGFGFNPLVLFAGGFAAGRCGFRGGFNPIVFEGFYAAAFENRRAGNGVYLLYDMRFLRYRFARLFFQNAGYGFPCFFAFGVFPAWLFGVPHTGKFYYGFYAGIFVPWFVRDIFNYCLFRQLLFILFSAC